MQQVFRLVQTRYGKQYLAEHSCVFVMNWLLFQTLLPTHLLRHLSNLFMIMSVVFFISVHQRKKLYLFSTNDSDLETLLYIDHKTLIPSFS